ncbi:aromatic amino acid lyase [Amycolatopsis balhimycina DSM 5908]|uniref:Aromatic amino acid lyase n=1 Tax=Amycolatopsis balhimycina DSM 5908 TaxID=1081091 RepID=A0A428WVC9_AMYBA|nr:aromatic amino acid ammonia-lyase [Amycolatopsis balhimycina]RSM47025.1 aromatic amino acid lyase [Amycolatopsis balhimycina DSM 5908]
MTSVIGTVAPVVLDGRTLSADQLIRVACERATVLLDDTGRKRMAASARASREIVDRQLVYGRNTGVGANRTESVSASDRAEHGLRLLRSHAGGIGDLLPEEQARAMLAVRINQLLAGGAGLPPAVAETLTAALNAGAYPAVHEFGAIGTGDLTALAETGLVMLGERPWLGGRATPPPITLEPGDALALISSNALTIGLASLAWRMVRDLVAATSLVAGLSFLAVDASLEPLAERVHRARPHPGQVLAAARMRRLIGTPPRQRARIQDPYGYRCFPQITGLAVDAVDGLERVLSVELNAAAENPLISAEDDAAYHHGGFHCAYLGMALDTTKLALLHTGQLSTARLTTLSEPGFTAQRPFLAEGATGSSGIMILEYSAHSALAEVRGMAQPAGLGHAVVSRGVEDHSSFAFQSAGQALRAARAFRLVLACELVAAMRTLRQRSIEPDPASPLAAAYRLADRALDPDMADRSLSPDVMAAAILLDRLAGSGEIEG